MTMITKFNIAMTITKVIKRGTKNRHNIRNNNSSSMTIKAKVKIIKIRIYYGYYNDGEHRILSLLNEEGGDNRHYTITITKRPTYI